MHITLALLLLSILLTWLYLRNTYCYWSERRVPCVKGVIPGIGNMWPVVSLRRNFFEFIQDIYEKHYCHSMVGFYDMMTPALMVCDPQLIKEVLQTNFASFHRNKLTVDPDLDPIFYNATIFTDGPMWTASRRRLMRAFSSVRLRMLFKVAEDVGRKMEEFLERRLERDGRIEIELRDLFSRYTAEFVANAIFDIQGSCFEERSSPFREMGKRIFEPSFGSALLQIVVFFAPWLNRIFRVPFLPKKADCFFRTTLRQVMELRRRETAPRLDFFQHIIDLERTEGEDLNEDALVAHAFTFYTDAYGTTSLALSYIGYQLIRHQNVQDKVRDEINSIIEQNSGTITYETLKRMTYLSRVISESQRMIPTEGAISKICTRTCELKGTEGLSCRVEPGTEIVIPMRGLHMDPRYWDDPSVFDPDRFDPEKGADIKKLTFLPFGEGPRMCAGTKMALLEMKICLSVLLRKYRLTISPKTRVPLKMSPGVFLPVPINGIWAFVEHV